MKLLIVGGYGVFGGRIVELLEGDARLTMIVAGRSLASARAFCAGRRGAATLCPARFDRDGDLAAQLAKLGPDIVVDASGPFQAYGVEAFRLVEACIAARISYLDLADGSEFVAGVARFDAEAKAAGVFVLSGVSSFPVLTAAVVRALTATVPSVDDITGVIAPSPFAGVGANVIRAIASYAGQPVASLGPNAKAIGRPFTQQRRITIAPPGRLPLRSTLFSLVDVPDLRALPMLWPCVKRIWMGAGPVPESLHRALIVCAWAVRCGLVRSLTPLAPLMHWATNTLRWGEHRGGMAVFVRGADAQGDPASASWHMIAEGEDGPLIPSMAVQALVLKLLDGTPPHPGARACLEEVSLDDYQRLFATRAIAAGFRFSSDTKGSLYRGVLGRSWDALPPALQAMHDGVELAEGEASVERGTSPLARLAAALMSFPPAMPRAKVSVRFAVTDGVETWTRNFAGRRFSSRQYSGSGRSEYLLCERFGALEFAMALVLDDGRLRLVMRRWRAFGVPLPLRLAPRSNAYEEAEDGVFRFHVEISHPLTGLIVRYRGWLKPQPPGPVT